MPGGRRARTQAPGFWGNAVGTSGRTRLGPGAGEHCWIYGRNRLQIRDTSRGRGRQGLAGVSRDFGGARPPPTVFCGGPRRLSRPQTPVPAPGSSGKGCARSRAGPSGRAGCLRRVTGCLHRTQPQARPGGPGVGVRQEGLVRRVPPPPHPRPGLRALLCVARDSHHTVVTGTHVPSRINCGVPLGTHSRPPTPAVSPEPWTQQEVPNLQGSPWLSVRPRALPRPLHQGASLGGPRVGGGG